jgi:hypothetical protein
LQASGAQGMAMQQSLAHRQPRLSYWYVIKPGNNAPWPQQPTPSS